MQEAKHQRLYHGCPFFVFFAKYSDLRENRRNPLSGKGFPFASDDVSDGLFSQTAMGSMEETASTICRLCCMVGCT